MKFIRVPLESRLLLTLASGLVPHFRRAEWRREWDGEIWWWITAQPGAARTWKERIALAIHCWGAVSDGLCLRLEDLVFASPPRWSSWH